MYLPPAEGEDGELYNNQPFVDRSALLRATLNSLAMNNVASVLNSRKHKKTLSPTDENIDEETEELEEKIESLEQVFDEKEEKEEKENKKDMP